MLTGSRLTFAPVGRYGRIGASVLVLSLAGAPGCRGGGTRREQPVATTTADGAAESPFCEAARELVDGLGSVVDPGGPPGPDGTAGLYRQLATFFATAAQAGPPEIQPDAAVAASVVAEYYGALQAAGFKEDQVPRETASKLQSPPFVTAAAHLAEYSRTRCPAHG